MKNRNRHEQVMEGPLPSRVCLDCDEDIPDTETAFYWETSEDEQFWLSSPKTEGPVCGECWETRDNREGPEPDGEVFRGGEAAAYHAEQQERIQRAQYTRWGRTVVVSPACLTLNRNRLKGSWSESQTTHSWLGRWRFLACSPRWPQSGSLLLGTPCLSSLLSVV